MAKPKSRADGEGSIYQRGDKWVAQVQFVGVDGRRKIKTRVTPTQGDARRARVGGQSATGHDSAAHHDRPVAPVGAGRNRAAGFVALPAQIRL